MIKLFKFLTNKSDPFDGPQIYIQIMAAFIPLRKYDGNISKGELVKIKFAGGKSYSQQFGYPFVGTEDGYDIIWEYVGGDWFKIVAKSKEIYYGQ